MENFGSIPPDPESTSEDDREITSAVNPEKTATINVGKAPAEDAKPSARKKPSQTASGSHEKRERKK